MSKNSLIANNDCDYLRVVLLCKGRGADKASYRPKSDESQWWGRRDALVRCVASFLFAANNPEGETTKTRKELVLLFDEDLSRLHMTIDAGDDNVGTVEQVDAFPKEETIVKLWKQAAQNLRKEVEYKGMRCVIHLDPTLSFVPTSSSTKTSKLTKAGSTAAKSNSIKRIDTKREVLEYMQKHCSIEFLREQKINSHPEVVLRKTNRKALLKIWETWTKHMHASSVTKEGKGTKDDDDENSHNSRRLKSIYKELLQFSQETTASRSSHSSSSSIAKTDKQIIAGTLHESSEEFPCFRFRPEEIIAGESSSLRVSYNICLFLGAVRDMTSHEKASKIPFVGVRFGTVPEFTSKILSVLVFHHANRVLDISMKRLLDKGNKTEDRSRSMPIEQQQQQQRQQSTCLNIICTVPKSSKEISVRIEDRDQTHWRLIRVIVCSLWRSKLVSSKSQISHTNMLHLVFDDGFVVALKERNFVEKLASQHQAAPSEFQILTALVQEIDRQSKSQAPPPPSRKPKASNNNSGDDCGSGWSRKKLAKRLVKSVVKSSPIMVTCTVGIESNATSTNELVSRFYDHSSSTVVASKEAIGAEADEPLDYGMLMVMDIATPSKHSILARQAKPGHEEDKPQEEPREIYRQLLSASRKQQIPTIQQRIILSNSNTSNWCWDREAASIIAIQHMCYQNRVFARRCCRPCKAAGSCQERSGKKRKKPS
jgi:hypothetical protein